MKNKGRVVTNEFGESGVRFTEPWNVPVVAPRGRLYTSFTSKDADTISSTAGPYVLISGYQ